MSSASMNTLKPVQKTIEKTYGDITVRLTLQTATAGIGLQRSLLMSRAISEETDLEESFFRDHPGGTLSVAQMTRRLLHTILFPAMTAAVVSVEGLPWPMTFEQFEQIPEDLEVEWETVTYELNPQWKPILADDSSMRREKEEAEKKVTSVTSV